MHKCTCISMFAYVYTCVSACLFTTASSVSEWLEMHMHTYVCLQMFTPVCLHVCIHLSHLFLSG